MHQLHFEKKQCDEYNLLLSGIKLVDTDEQWDHGFMMHDLFKQRYRVN